MEKLKYVKSCFKEFIDIDDKQLSDMSIDEVKDVVKELIDSISDKGYIKEILMDVIDYAPGFSLDEDDVVNCEQCGDWNWFKTYNKIKE